MTSADTFTFSFTESFSDENGNITQIFSRDNGNGQVAKTIKTDGTETLAVDYIDTNVSLTQTIDETSNITTNIYANPDGVNVTEFIGENNTSTTYEKGDNLTVYEFSSTYVDATTNENITTSGFDYNNTTGTNFYSNTQSNGHSSMGFYDNVSRIGYSEFTNSCLLYTSPSPRDS